jgi:FixJ family two-component response regulator
MVERVTLHILDSDSARRAQLARLAFAAGHHAEIYGTTEELLAHAPGTGLLLAHDEPPGRVPALIGAMMRAGHWLPVIAIGDAPDTWAVVRTIKAGALDYLAIPTQIAPLNDAIARASQEAESHRVQRARAAEARQRSPVSRCANARCSTASPKGAATRPSPATSTSARAPWKSTG